MNYQLSNWIHFTDYIFNFINERILMLLLSLQWFSIKRIIEFWFKCLLSYFYSVLIPKISIFRIFYIFYSHYHKKTAASLGVFWLSNLIKIMIIFLPSDWLQMVFNQLKDIKWNSVVTRSLNQNVCSVSKFYYSTQPIMKQDFKS